MSKLLADLEEEVEVLRNDLLPMPFDPLGVYADARRVQALTRAFVVLSHAEIEGYLEAWTKEIVKAAERVWASAARVTAPLSYLIAASEERLGQATSLSLPRALDSHARFAALVTKVLTGHRAQVKSNNGIKESNLLKLFEPIGVPSAAFAPTLIPSLNSFGSKRGEHAHSSARAIVNVLDPETEYKNVKALLADLAVLDTWLITYKRRVR